MGFARTYNEESTTRRTEGQLARIFSGVDIDVPYIQAGSLYFPLKDIKGISGAHWLNFLADEWVEKLGGLQALREQLPEDAFTVEPYPGGVFIQAGPYPEPGHVKDGLPPAYVWLNRVLMPIRVAKFSYHMGRTPGELALPEDREPYFRRFDQASEAFRDRLAAATHGEVATSSQSRERLNVPGGTPCPRAGWWFTPAKANSRRYFKQGEVFPDYPDSDYGSTFWQWSGNQDAPTLS